MDEYINKSEVFNIIDETVKTWNPNCGISKIEYLRIRVKNIPGADVQKVVRGHWVKETIINQNEKYISYSPVWKCSACGKEYDPSWTGMVNFCYNCGADMRGDNK